MPRGRWWLEIGVPLQAPPLQQLQSRHHGWFWPSEALGSPTPVTPTPGRPGLPPQHPRAETKARGRAASPQRPLGASGQAGRTRTGVPKVTRTRYPSSRSAKPRRGRARSRGPGGDGRLQPAARRGLQGGEAALRKSPGGSPGHRRTPAPASRAGLPGVPGRVLCTVLPIPASGRGVGGGALRVHGG